MEGLIFARLPQVLIAPILLGLMLTSFASAGEAQVIEPEISGKRAFGKLAFDKFCSDCHGASGVGTDKGPPFLHRYYVQGHHGDRAFYVAATNGVRAHHWGFGDMPPVEGITEQYVDMIVDYVRALQKANGFN